MTPGAHTMIFTAEAFAALGAPDLVYVRPIKAAEILADAPVGAAQDFDL
ncbi:MAG: small protein, partial [Caulobacter sp. 12-67-6]